MIGPSLVLKEIRRRELWPQLQARLKSNDCHNPAGSSEGGEFCGGDGGAGGTSGGRAFDSAPATGAGAVAWRRRMQERYTNDKAFRTEADAVAMFTQGEYAHLRAIAIHDLTGEWPPDYKESSVPEWVDRQMSAERRHSHQRPSEPAILPRDVRA